MQPMSKSDPELKLYISVSFDSLSISGYMGAISRVLGADGTEAGEAPLLESMLIWCVSSFKTSLNAMPFMFWPSKCNRRKSPI